MIIALPGFLLYIFHFLKFFIFVGVNYGIAGYAFLWWLQAKYNQSEVIKPNSTKKRKMDIVFSKMTLGIALTYSVLIVDLILLFYLDWLLTPNMRTILILQMSSLIT